MLMTRRLLAWLAGFAIATAAVAAHAQAQAPDALIKSVSSDVLDTVKSDPSFKAGDINKVIALGFAASRRAGRCRRRGSRSRRDLDTMRATRVVPVRNSPAVWTQLKGGDAERGATAKANSDERSRKRRSAFDGEDPKRFWLCRGL